MPGQWGTVDANARDNGERVHTILRELRHKYSLERAELVAAVTEQVSDVRAELEAARDGATECTRSVASLEKQISAMAAHHTGPSDLIAATKEANARLAAVDEALHKASDEGQLLKTALLNDRMRREERLRKSESEDADADLRIRQLEEANAAVRAELRTLKSASVASLNAVSDIVAECKYDAPTTHTTNEMNSLRESVMADLQHLRSEQLAIRERVDTTVMFCQDEEKKRTERVRALEGCLHEIEQRPVPKTAHVVDTQQWDRHTFTPPYFVPARGDDGLVSTPRRADGASRPPAAVLTVRDRVAQFYASFNPAKLSSLDKVLAEYHGAEEELMSALEVHYNAFGYFSNH
jgi:chromosome segregation ATPase